jgi:mono/diheme cytochrome c family protein
MLRFLAAAALCACAAAGCKDVNPQLANGDSPSNVVFPAANVSYRYNLQPLFDQACALSGCHDDGAHQSALKLTSFGNLMFQLPGVVVPGKPDQSTLVFRIEGRVGDRMPPTTNQLNDNQINGIRTWVAEGAKNN